MPPEEPTDDSPICPYCGGVMQATTVTEVYYTLEHGKWIENDSELTQVRVYCDSDHKAPSEFIEALPDLP
tara:strand:+ start:310 stop:519 length:210 start_codon:yes stop_codon:yes gene_type:complete